MPHILRIQRLRPVHVVRAFDDRPAIGEHRELILIDVELEQKLVERHLAERCEFAGHRFEIEFPGNAVAHLDGVAAALRGWAGELRELQSDTLYLDWRLGDARRIEKQSWERLVAFEQGAGPLEPDQRHEWNQLTMLHEEALARQREAEAALTERENTYRERAVHYGALIRDSHIGGMYGVGPGIRIGSGPPQSWCTAPVVLPAGWDCIEVDGLWARGRQWRLVAEHGAEHATLEPVR